MKPQLQVDFYFWRNFSLNFSLNIKVNLCLVYITELIACIIRSVRLLLNCLEMHDFCRSTICFCCCYSTGSSIVGLVTAIDIGLAEFFSSFRVVVMSVILQHWIHLFLIICLIYASRIWLKLVIWFVFLEIFFMFTSFKPFWILEYFI